MKTLARVVLVFVLFAFLSACSQDSDGTGHLVVPFNSGSSTSIYRYVQVDDIFSSNRIYLDQVNFAIYCDKGPDKVILLPQSAKRVNVSFPYVAIRVEAVCEMGQERFDKLVLLVATTSPSQ